MKMDAKVDDNVGITPESLRYQFGKTVRYQFGSQQVALGGLALSGSEVFDRSLVHLHIAICILADSHHQFS